MSISLQNLIPAVVSFLPSNVPQKQKQLTGERSRLTHTKQSIKADFIGLPQRKGNRAMPIGLLSSVVYHCELQLSNSAKPCKNNKDDHLVLAFKRRASC